MHRHYLASRAPPTALVDAVRGMCGTQSQIMLASMIALWARVQNLTRKDVQRALWQERTLVRTWCMRRTVHLLPADDLPIYVSALKRSCLRYERQWIAKRGVSAREAEAMIEAILKALDEGPLTRRRLAERVVSLVGARAKRWVEHGWGGVVKQACMLGLVCFGPNQGQEITFVRCDQWLPHLKDLPAEEAGAALLRRYLASYGPATLQDFTAWTGMQVKEAAPIWDGIREELVKVSINGRLRWVLRQDLEQLQAHGGEAGVVRLLPSFDSFLLGHRDKSHLVDPTNYKRVYRKAGWLSPVVLVDGRILGVWSHRRRGSRLQLNVELFERVPRDVREAIEGEAQDLGRFLDAPCQVTYS